MTVSVLLADDHRMVREGLRALLERQANLRVIGEAGDGLEAIALTRSLRPEVVIIDLVMPGLNGFEATRQILAEFPETKVIALSIYADRRFVAEALRAGAVGYLLKECAFEELAHAVQTVVAGSKYLCPGVTGVVLEELVRGEQCARRSVFTLLTARERQVLQLLVEGKSAREIARLLEIAVKTASAHRGNIMRKLQIRSVAELTRYAIREGITPL